MENKDILQMYNYNMHLERISMGRIASLTCILLVPIFYLKDVYMTQYENSTFLWRLIPILACIIFTSVSFSRLRDHYRVIKYTYVVLMYSILIMMFGIFYVNYGAEDGRYNSFLIAGMVTTLLIIHLFSTPVRKYISGFSVSVIIFFIITFTIKGGDSFIISNLINPSATILLISVFAYSNEKKSFNEFKSKVLLELNERDLINEMEYRKAMENELKNEVLHDSLTKIYNKRAAEKMLSEKIKQFNDENRRFSLVFIDLDDLKSINDSNGHDAGDKYITSFVEIVNEYLENNSYMFRVGGDEFLIFFEDIDFDDATSIMEAITDICMTNSIRFSFGVSSSDGNEESDLYNIIKDADIKMYNQKRRKKQLI